MTLSLFGQSDSSRITRLLADYRIKPSIGLQFWSTYSMNMQVYDAETGTYRRVDDRVNVQLRRSRFGLSGQPYERLKFNIVTALDLLGHDVLAATQAGSLNGNAPIFRIWNAWLQWQLTRESDRLYLVTGYFLPLIGRESITPALRSTSFEKAWSQFYLRRQLTGAGSGRALGLMLAGQYHDPGGNFHLTYEAALQNPTFTAYDGNSVGERYRPLLSSRVSFQFGDAEAASYSVTRRVNYFGDRTGLTVSLTAARQGETDLFSSNEAYGWEWVGNHGQWQVDGEYLWLRRRLETEPVTQRWAARTGYLRISRNWPLPAERTLQPTVSYWWFRGPTTREAVTTAQQLELYTGSDSGLDVGFNLYLNPDTKFSLFYAHRSGSAGAGDPVVTNNTFFQQAGAGSVRRGSYLGLGSVVIW
ncbi:hypothetical protein CLV84_1315 [Neolewinella xylanilytica]|uniref:Alginate export domain-containing protein n=1 Tax=Neolewinella xylanilytica TaxID=1514080 RepID=A0A2S6IA64_9BACT|nr:hypothetical protein [Neolewinella xylanilytica]PPK88349.1 hypothetical protein CLV84_1315 [Neolewinella xylanilytica]